MYYPDLSEGVSPNDAQMNIGTEMFFISPITVKRWDESCETKRENYFVLKRVVATAYQFCTHMYVFITKFVLN